jgi:hypothetical protein
LMGTLTLPMSCAWISSSNVRPTRTSSLCIHSYYQEPGSRSAGNVFDDIFVSGNNEGTEVSPPSSQRGVLDTRISEPRLLAVDVISVAIAAHLMAFADVMSDPLQFEPPLPSPLPALIQRDSLLTLCWVLSAMCSNGYRQETVASNRAVVTTTALMSAGFTLLRVASVFVSMYLAGYECDGWEIARQCYVTAMTVGALRFFYGQYNR